MARWKNCTIYREADYYDGDLQVILDGKPQENLFRRSSYTLRLDLNPHTIKVKFPGFLGTSVTLHAPAGDDDVYYDLGVLENQQIMTHRWGESGESWWAVTWPAPAADLRSIGFDLNKFRSELDFLLNPASGKLYHQMKSRGITEVWVNPNGGGVFFKQLGDDYALERIYYNEIGDAAHTTELQQIWIRREGEAKLIRQFIRDYMQNRYPGLEFVGNDTIRLTAAAPSAAPKTGGDRKLTIRRTPENPSVPVTFHIDLQKAGDVAAGNEYTVTLKDSAAHELLFANYGSDFKKYKLPEGNEPVTLEIGVEADGKVSLRRGVSKWIIGKDGKNIIMPWYSGNKLIRELRSIFRVNMPLYRELYEKDMYLRFAAEKFGIYFWDGEKCAYLFSYKDIVWDWDGQDIYVDSEADFAQLMQFIGQVLNSDACPGLCTVLPNSPLIRKDPESAVRPSVMTSAGEESETTRLIKECIKETLSLSGGKVFEMLLSGKADHIEVSVLLEEVDLSAHYAGADEFDYDDVLTVKYGLECDRIFQDMEKLPTIKAEEMYYTLDEHWERMQLMDRIRDMINDETTFGLYMEEDRIYLDPEVRKRPEYPDVNDSMTTSLLWILVNNEFGEETEFEERIKTHPTTCYLSAEEDRIRITVMEESEGGNTRIVEFPYAECTYDKFPEGVGWETLEIALWQNRYERLTRQEDRAELEDYLMFFIGGIPHVIVEGNSFRSRREGEELIEVEQTLTAKVISQGAAKLFDLNGRFVDILRHSNIAYCQIAVYNDYIKFFFIDSETDEIAESIKYDYNQLADEDFLSGEGCFSRLTCQYETDQLAECIGKSVCQLPYFTCSEYSEGIPNYSNIYLNKELVPMLYVPYVPAKSEEPETSAMPEAVEVPEVPEAETANESKTVETADFAEAEPESAVEPAEEHGPAFSVHASPTTWAMVAAMNLQFADGGGLNRYMKDGGFSGADMTTSAYEIGIGFWKNGACTTRLSMQYAQFNKGIPGEFKSLSEDDQQILQAVIRTAVPYFDV